MNNALIESRKRFINEMSEETGLTLAQMRKILREQGIEKFSMDNKTEIRAILRGEAAMRFKLAEKIKAEIEAHPVQEYDCPIPSCDGKKKYDGRGGLEWVCSIAGSWHYWVFRTAIIIEKQGATDFLNAVNTLLEYGNGNKNTENTEATRTE